MKIDTSIKKVYLKYASEFEHKYRNLESLPQVYLSLKINASIQKVYFNYTFTISVCKFRKSTSSILLTQKKNAFQKQVQSILEVYFITKFLMNSKLEVYLTHTNLFFFFNYFYKVTNFGSQNISKSIPEVCFAFRVQKYI